MPFGDDDRSDALPVLPDPAGRRPAPKRLLRLPSLAGWRGDDAAGSLRPEDRHDRRPISRRPARPRIPRRGGRPGRTSAYPFRPVGGARRRHPRHIPGSAPRAVLAARAGGGFCPARHRGPASRPLATAPASRRGPPPLPLRRASLALPPISPAFFAIQRAVRRPALAASAGLHFRFVSKPLRRFGSTRRGKALERPTATRPPPTSLLTTSRRPMASRAD